MKTIGIAGGGQLGRMLTNAAHTLGFRVVTLDPVPLGPAGQVSDEQIAGDYTERDLMRLLASKSDVVTFEIESVNAEALREIEGEGKPVHPTPRTLAIIKDKLAQKRFLAEKSIAVAPFAEERDAERLGYPYVLKARSGGFDGRGNALVENADGLADAFAKLKGAPAYAEGFVTFEKELAVVAARTTAGDIKVFPLVETIHRNHICHMVLCPAPVSEDIAHKAHALAEKVLAAFDGAGVFAIEMFLVSPETTLSARERVEGSAHSTSSGQTADYQLFVNEVAPRVHNSGHHTIEACETSQFEQHIRAVAGLPLGATAMKVPAAVMINILGERDGKADAQGIEEAENLGGVHVHIYGKMDTRRERKMGHITATADSLEEAREKAEKARALISI